MISKIGGFVSQIKLKGGLARQICMVLIVMIIVFGMIALSVNKWWVSLAITVLATIIILIILWRLLNLANKNPSAALMNGIQYLVHEQQFAATKKSPNQIANESEFQESDSSFIIDMKGENNNA